MRLEPCARIAVIGAGPGGIAAAKHALDAGFDVTVFEASDDLGGQWNTNATQSGAWPGMPTNTSRAMTAFSDLDPDPDIPLHPQAEEIHDYLRRYAERFEVSSWIRFEAAVELVTADGEVDGEPFDGVVVASGRFRRPRLAPGLDAFAGEVIHAFDYPGAETFRGRRVLVYGNGVSGLEIAADLANVTDVVSAFRKPRYVIQKNVEGVSSDWQWYTAFGALERAHLPPEEFGARLRERILRVAGDPADFGAPEPDPDILVAGVSLCQGYLDRVAEGRIVCRPGIAAIEGRTARFTDGSVEQVDAIVAATGYDLDIPFLGDEIWDAVGPELSLYGRTLHPDLPRVGFVGQFLLQGPFFSLLELQARLIVGVWAGDVPAPSESRTREVMAVPRPPVESHNVIAAVLAEELGAAPELLARPELAEALLFGPLLSPRYRLDGPGALPDAADRFAAQVAASPRAPLDPADVEALRAFGLPEAADLVASSERL